MRFGQALFFDLTAHTHIPTDLHRRCIAEGQTAQAPAHGHKAQVLRRYTLDKGQFLTVFHRFQGGCGQRLDCNRRFTGRAEAALNQGHDLTVLSGTPQHLADRFAFTQHFHVEADRHTRLGRTDKCDSQ